MTGGFFCPKCEKMSRCVCGSCSKNATAEEVKDIKPIEEVTGETIKCGYCGHVFHYDESLDTELKQIKNAFSKGR